MAAPLKESVDQFNIPVQTIEEMIEGDIAHWTRPRRAGKEVPTVIRVPVTHDGVSAELIFSGEGVHMAGIFKLAYREEVGGKVFRRMHGLTDFAWLAVNDFDDPNWDDVLAVIDQYKICPKTYAEASMVNFLNSFKLPIPESIKEAMEKKKKNRDLEAVTIQASTLAIDTVQSLFQAGRQDHHALFLKAFTNKFMMYMEMINHTIPPEFS